MDKIVNQSVRMGYRNYLPFTYVTYVQLFFSSIIIYLLLSSNRISQFNDFNIRYNNLLSHRFRHKTLIKKNHTGSIDKIF